MATVRQVAPRLKDEPMLGILDPEPLQPTITEIIQRWRGHKNYMITKDRRRFPEVLACFHLRVAQVLSQRGKGNIKEALGNCVEHFAHCDCPAQETVQLQVTVEGILFQQMQKFLNDGEKKKEELLHIKDSALQVKVEDVRRVYELTEVLHSQIMDYLVKYSRQMTHLPSPDPSVDEVEILSSFESVLPRKSLLYWMDELEKVKSMQLDELANIVHGIRVFNKYTGKGGATLDLPYGQFKMESEILTEKMDEAMKNVNDRVEGLTKGILLYIEEYGIQHIFIQRLRDDLAYSHQTKIYLQNLKEFVFERHKTVLAYNESSARCIDKIWELRENRTCIPAELGQRGREQSLRISSSHKYLKYMTTLNLLRLNPEPYSSKAYSNLQVFPLLQKLGICNKSIAEDYNLLKGHMEVANALLDLIWRPCYVQSPITAKRLENKAKNFLFLPRGVSKKESPLDSIVEQGGPQTFLCDDPTVLEEIHDKLQYGGFCVVNLVRYEGVLIEGDPRIGFLRLEDRYFAFADQVALNRFLKAPQAFIEGVRDIVLRLPHLIHILGLHSTVAVSFLSIPQVFSKLATVLHQMLQTIPNSFPREFAIQTYTHPLPEHTWDEETLRERIEELKRKETHTSQTTMEVSHFHRDSISQVWPPKDKWTQTGVSSSTCMPRYVRVLHNVRGEVHQDFKVVKSSYEWP